MFRTLCLKPIVHTCTLYVTINVGTPRNAGCYRDTRKSIYLFR